MKPDVVLVDIRLYGEKSGLDVARYIKESKDNLPYIIVSSQFDNQYIEMAMRAGAAGYITKPLVKETLWSSLELAVLKAEDRREEEYIDIKINHGLQRIKISEILYIKSDHVYVEIVGVSFKYYARYALSELLDMLSNDDFLRCHRSYIINTSKIKRYTASRVFIDEVPVPISAKYKDEVLSKI